MIILSCWIFVFRVKRDFVNRIAKVDILKPYTIIETVFLVIISAASYTLAIKSTFVVHTTLKHAVPCYDRCFTFVFST